MGRVNAKGRALKAVAKLAGQVADTSVALGWGEPDMMAGTVASLRSDYNAVADMLMTAFSDEPIPRDTFDEMEQVFYEIQFMEDRTMPPVDAPKAKRARKAKAGPKAEEPAPAPEPAPKAKRSRKVKPAPASEPALPVPAFGHVWKVQRSEALRPPRLELRTGRDRTRVIIRKARIERDRARAWGCCLFEPAC